MKRSPTLKWTLVLSLISLSLGCEDTTNLSQRSSASGDINDEVATMSSKSDGEKLSLNLYQREDNLYAWRKTRASLDPEEDVIFYWQGYIYNVQDQDPLDFPARGYNVDFKSPLFRFEGFNVARFAEDGAGGYYMMSREVSVYEDPNTGEIINCWENSLHPDRPLVSVMHVANDPVNFGVGEVQFTELGDRVSFFSDVLLSYRSPLAEEERYAQYSASDVYQSNELFNFFVSREDLADPSLRSAPVEISWTRVGQYLPWMQMGDRPGKLIYHVRGYKVLKGLEALPLPLIDWTLNVAGPNFLTAPEIVPRGYQPNATTWRVFREIAEAGGYQARCE